MIVDYKKAHYNNVVIKLTSKCNLRCKYCYVSSHEMRHAPMQMDVLENIFDKYTAYVQTLEPRYKFIYFIWHGGEPLTCGLDYFQKLIHLQSKFTDRDCTIYNGIQTNGTLINKDWINFFKCNHFSVGLSLDGPHLIQNLNRAGSNFDSSKSVSSAIGLLNEMDLDFAITAVVTDEIASKWENIYRFFSAMDIRYVDFLPCYNPDLNLYLSQAGFDDFYLPLLDKWLTDNNPKKPSIRLFSDFLSKIENSDNSDYLGCEVMGQCGEVQYITELGDLYPCTVLPINDKMKMGNILTEELNSCFNSRNSLDFQSAYNKNSICNLCDLFKICRGGCAARRLISPPKSNNTHANVDYYCKSRRIIIEKLVEFVLLKKIGEAVYNGKENRNTQSVNI